MVLPQHMRLKGHKAFDHLHREGVRFHSSSLLLKVAKANPPLNSCSLKAKPQSNSCKVAVAISNKVSKKAVFRNRLRRYFHNHLKQRLSNKALASDNWVLISLKPKAASLDASKLSEECDVLLHKAGLFV